MFLSGISYTEFPTTKVFYESVDYQLSGLVWNGTNIPLDETLHLTTANVYFGWSLVSDRFQLW